MTRFLAIIILIVVGCFVFRYLVRLLNGAKFPRNEGSGHSHRNWEHINTEEDYRHVLGVTNRDSPAAIRKKYKELLSKYHPDKVQHLGIEFQEMAERKTRAIMEAYEFFRKKNNL
jgi:preprotein translocase subunit Sec63